MCVIFVIFLYIHFSHKMYSHWSLNIFVHKFKENWRQFFYLFKLDQLFI